MAYLSLQHFIKILEKNGELIRVKRFVDPVLEIAEITDRFSKLPDGGKALLFENTGTPFPVLTNAFGSEKRICLALGAKSLDQLQSDVAGMLAMLAKPRITLWDKLSAFPQLGKLASWLPTRSFSKATCQQVVHHNPDLSMMPILKCWPHDGGRFITLPMVHTKDPETGIRNVGMYRMQVFDSLHTGMHWHKHKTGAKHFEVYKRLGKLMPVAVTLGGDPAYTYAATAPMPENMDEYILAGFLRKKKVKLVKCMTVDLEVPEDVDFVIEGYIDPNDELAWEGPFGDHTGFYSLADWYPRFRVTCITHRKDAVYPATIVGVPPMEDAFIAKATERIFMEPIRYTLLPELDDLVLPVEGVAHNLALVKFKDEYHGQAYRVMNALWGAGQMMFNKILIALPSHIDLNNGLQVLKHMCGVVNLNDDLFFGKGPLDVLDHSSNQPAFGSKLFIDATTNAITNDFTGVDAELICKNLLSHSPHVLAVNRNLIEQRVPVAIVLVSKQEITDWQSFIQSLSVCPGLEQLKAIVLVDMNSLVNDLQLVLWWITGNIDPQRDVKIVKSNALNELLIIDGTRKAYSTDRFNRLWPNVVAMDPDTIDRIDQMWQWLDIGEFVESPSLKMQNLVADCDAVVRF